MRALSICAVLLGCLGVASAGVEANPEACLSPGEIQEAVSQSRAVEPKAAVAAARRRVPGADVMRGRLCQNGGALVYQIMALSKDGRLVHVTIDAPSGKVVDVQ